VCALLNEILKRWVFTKSQFFLLDNLFCKKMMGLKIEPFVCVIFLNVSLNG
jgi:hypothetical protein